MRYSTAVQPTPCERLCTPAAVAALALMPYATVGMGFQHALWLDGLGYLGIVLTLLAVGRQTVSSLAGGSPWAVRWGLGLYLAAAAFGAIIGLTSGNPLRFIVSQTASMVLWPAGFIAFAAGATPTLRRVAAGLGIASAVALAVHLAVAFATRGAPEVRGEALRLTLRNDVSFTGLSVMALLVCLGWWAETRRPAAALAAAAAAVLVVGSMSRGAWIVALIGVVAFWTLRQKRVWWALVVPPLATALGVAALFAASRWVTARGEFVIPRSEETMPMEGGGVEIRRNVAVNGRPIEITIAVRGRSSARPVLIVSSRDAAGRSVVVAQVTPNPVAPDRPLTVVQFLPAGTSRLSFGLWQQSGGGEVVTCEVRELPGAMAGWLRTLDLRIRQTALALVHPAQDGTVGYRLAEWAAVKKAWTRATWFRWLSGQGLGATVQFPNSSWDEHGHRIDIPTANYLHNFYVFLFFKLGLAGAAALAGLLLVAGWTWRAAIARRSTADGATLAAAAACWLAYLVWSVTSPEILDFHTAPLWGALVAATVAGTGRGAPQGAAPDPRSHSSSTSRA